RWRADPGRVLWPDDRHGDRQFRVRAHARARRVHRPGMACSPRRQAPARGAERLAGRVRATRRGRASRGVGRPHGARAALVDPGGAPWPDRSPRTPRAPPPGGGPVSVWPGRLARVGSGLLVLGLAGAVGVASWIAPVPEDQAVGAAAIPVPAGPTTLV